MRVDGKDFDNEAMTIQGLMKEEEDDDFEELDIFNLRSYLEKNEEKDEKEKEERVWIKAQRSISQELAHRLEKEKPRIEVTLPKPSLVINWSSKRNRPNTPPQENHGNMPLI
jgi:hypothetical protein